MSAAKITTWSGGNAGVSLEGANVLVSPAGNGNAQRAVEVARMVLDLEAIAAPLRVEIGDLARKNETLRDLVTGLRAQLDEAERRNVSALTGRRRFFSEVLMVPAKKGEWAGEVWLLDPVKKFLGQALTFKSAAEVHELHPELWVIGTTEEGVLLDAWSRS